ncbi:hypothetical protein [Hymenobacter jeollabukensis]|uniref:Uncharacterized protein n=1 Tax=Hymenobacter jeollabukensis TaxID=2025313 RepID=A0A5R8WKV4_9BACT|nr:hypothetical protein [Hymenobacter jeollabukensis]TLM89203.1 hypothetical protein FDY95_21780 [Hymenobacter jeollabukensis]
MNQPASARITLYHRQHARRQRAKGLMHLVPALVLLSSGLNLVQGEALSGVMLAEIVVGAAYVALLVREILHLRHHPHHREAVAWLEIAGAGILALEGYHIWHRHHEAELAGAPHRIHVLPWLYGALALFYVGLAFSMQHLDARRHLHLLPDGFSLRMHPLGLLRRWHWADIDMLVPVGADELLIRRRDGQEDRLSFAPLHEGGALREQLLQHATGGPLHDENEAPA